MLNKKTNYRILSGGLRGRMARKRMIGAIFMNGAGAGDEGDFHLDFLKIEKTVTNRILISIHNERSAMYFKFNSSLTGMMSLI